MPEKMPETVREQLTKVIDDDIIQRCEVADDEPQVMLDLIPEVSEETARNIHAEVVEPAIPDDYNSVFTHGAFGMEYAHIEIRTQELQEKIDKEMGGIAGGLHEMFGSLDAD